MQVPVVETVTLRMGAPGAITLKSLKRALLNK